MKRLVVAAAAAVVLVLLVSGPAFADGGPHGGYTATTDACAGCHRAHTAAGPKLLIATEATLCLTCHGQGVTGAETNVADGVYEQRMTPPGTDGTPGVGLKGGGFLNAKMDTSFSGSASSLVPTSMHTYNGDVGTAWGNGAIDAAANPGSDIALSCAGCHDPHGNGNYRILRPIPRNSGAAADINVTDAAGNYTVADANGNYFGEGYLGDHSDGMTPQYQELTGWCSQCHTRYMAGTDDGITDSGDAIFAYRHSTADTRGGGGTCGKCHGGGFAVEVTYGAYFNHEVQCMTCHVAHGTSASVGGYAADVPYPDGSTVGGSERSSLLRVDGRGTCQACHDKS